MLVASPAPALAAAEPAADADGAPPLCDGAIDAGVDAVGSGESSFD